MFVPREHKYIIVDRLSGLLYGRFRKVVTTDILPTLMKNIICRMAIIPRETLSKHLHKISPGSDKGGRGYPPFFPSKWESPSPLVPAQQGGTPSPTRSNTGVRTLGNDVTTRKRVPELADRIIGSAIIVVGVYFLYLTFR